MLPRYGIVRIQTASPSHPRKQSVHGGTLHPVMFRACETLALSVQDCIGLPPRCLRLGISMSATTPLDPIATRSTCNIAYCALGTAMDRFVWVHCVAFPRTLTRGMLVCPTLHKIPSQSPFPSCDAGWYYRGVGLLLALRCNRISNVKGMGRGLSPPAGVVRQPCKPSRHRGR